MLAAGAWYTLALVVRPFGWPVPGPQRPERRYPPPVTAKSFSR
jgi:hypothetical protein